MPLTNLHAIVLLVSRESEVSSYILGVSNPVTGRGTVGFQDACSFSVHHPGRKASNNTARPRYHTHLWQPSYYDTLIRNDIHMEKTRQYILANPARWIERMNES